jgi:hypothetical protein
VSEFAAGGFIGRQRRDLMSNRKNFRDFSHSAAEALDGADNALVNSYKN